MEYCDSRWSTGGGGGIKYGRASVDCRWATTASRMQEEARQWKEMRAVAQLCSRRCVQDCRCSGGGVVERLLVEGGAG